jgi:hypothetical protein
MRRRDFIGATVGLAGLARFARVDAQEKPSVPTRAAKVEKLFKAPDAHPNALETADDGLWIADQISERVFRVDWETGKVLQEFQSESHNTSGIAVGGGYLWLNANGAGSAAQMREKRPRDRPFGEIIQADMKTGKTIRAYDPPWGGVHGAEYVAERKTLWVVALSVNALAELDVNDNFRIVRLIPVRHNTPHGLAWQNGAIWCLFAADRVAVKMDPDSGQALQVITLAPTDPDPHGMCIRNGYMYYCDAGLGGGRETSPGSAPAFVCRFSLTT